MSAEPFSVEDCAWKVSSSSKVFDPYPESKDQMLGALVLGAKSFGDNIVAKWGGNWSGL